MLFKSGDCLRFAIFEDFEIFFVQAGYSFPFVVGRYNVYQNESDFGFDGRNWSARSWTGRSRRSSLRVKRQSNKQKQRCARGTAAAKIHTGLLERELYHKIPAIHCSEPDGSPMCARISCHSSIARGSCESSEARRRDCSAPGRSLSLKRHSPRPAQANQSFGYCCITPSKMGIASSHRPSSSRPRATCTWAFARFWDTGSL